MPFLMIKTTHFKAIAYSIPSDILYAIVLHITHINRECHETKIALSRSFSWGYLS